MSGSRTTRAVAAAAFTLGVAFAAHARDARHGAPDAGAPLVRDAGSDDAELRQNVELLEDYELLQDLDLVSPAPDAGAPDEPEPPP